MPSQNALRFYDKAAFFLPDKTNAKIVIVSTEIKADCTVKGKTYPRPFSFFEMNSIAEGHKYKNLYVFEVMTYHHLDALGFTLLRC